MCSEGERKPQPNKRARRTPVQEPVAIDNVLDLNPHTDDILGALNADKRLALLAVADPVGVLKDLGYELSPRAARELRHHLPRLSRQQRDRYLRWLRGLRHIPDTLKIQLVNRPSGRDLLRGSTPPTYETMEVAPGEGAGGFDVVAQFGESLCNAMLKRQYAFGNLPRSVYRINGKLAYYHSTSAYEVLRSSAVTADREVHLGQPTLKLLTNKSDKVRVTSSFIALGFASKEIKGSVAVDAKLAVKKDSKGQPSYVELTFDSVAASDLTTTLSTTGLSATVVADLRKMLLDIYKNFSALKKPAPNIPITFTLVDSSELSGKGTTVQVEATPGIRKPTGAPETLLLVGLARADSSNGGDLSAVANAVQSGGNLGLLQDAAWLEQRVNAGFAQALPIRFDPDSGKVDKNGDFRIDSITWSYRDGGLTGNLCGTLEDAYLWVDTDIEGEVKIDVTFHSSEPTVTVTSTSDMSEADCWTKLLFVLLAIIVGAAVGAAIGAVIGGIAAGAFATGALLGAVAGGGIGLGTALALVDWPMSFDTSGIEHSSSTASAAKIELKVTHTRKLPVTGGSVSVVPNDFAASSDGTSMSAKVIGPSYAEAQPSVSIKGNYTIDVTPTSGSSTESRSSSEQKSSRSASRSHLNGASAAEIDDATIHVGVVSPAHRDLEPMVAGTIELAYEVDSTSGFQGELSYMWTFNGQSIGTESSVDVKVELTEEMVKKIKPNHVVELGVISVTVTDSFGRSASASAKITVGSAKDLRSFAPAVAELRQFVDPITEAGVDRRDWISMAGWQQEGSPLLQHQGELVGMSTFNTPLNEDTLAVLGTRV